MAEGRAGWLPRIRTWGIDRFRRSRFFPVGMPDKRVDPKSLGRPIRQSVLVFFPGSGDSVYQLLPWLPALEALDHRHGVVIIFRDSRTAAVVAAASSIPTMTLARYGQLDDILGRSDVKLALYVNHDPINFECLRFTSLIHVYLGHGDSDKGVSVSNQVKAYDYCFLAGEAALQRTAAHVMLYNARARSLLIGQPQLDVAAPVGEPDPTRPTVLYAPTWEGSQPSMSYGSLLSHGRRILEALSPHYRVIYRPHPLTGVIDSRHAEADRELRRMAARVDVGVDLARSFADADLLIADVSAVLLNWLPTGKPMLVTRPAVPVARSAINDSVPMLAADDDVAAAVELHLRADPTAGARAALVEFYLGDITPGAAIGRFVQACEQLMDERDRLLAGLRERGAVGR